VRDGDGFDVNGGEELGDQINVCWSMQEFVAILDAMRVRARKLSAEIIFQGYKDLRATAAGAAGGFRGRSAAVPSSMHPVK
jgi:hypothetical protein